MHELSIAGEIIAIVKAEMRRNGLRKLRGVKVRVGELTAVDPEALSFSFHAIVRGTRLEGAGIQIEDVPLTGRCRGCGKTARLDNFMAVCAFCGEKGVERIAGDELEVVSMEAS